MHTLQDFGKYIPTLISNFQEHHWYYVGQNAFLNFIWGMVGAQKYKYSVSQALECNGSFSYNSWIYVITFYKPNTIPL